MATSGLRMSRPAQFVERALLPRNARAGVFALCLLLAGCASTLQLGQPPRTDRLGMLKPGVSTAKEVATALGEPAGRGAGRMPNFPTYDIWLYESSVTEGKESHLHMLLVFVRPDGTYEGHIWFKSDYKFQETRK